MTNRLLASAIMGLLIAAGLTVGPSAAQQVPGAPDATTTIDGRYLPPPAPPFGGEINLNAAQSKTWWPPRIVPPRSPLAIDTPALLIADDVVDGLGGHGLWSS